MTRDDRQRLREYVEHNGAMHTDTCPADDTCDCVYGPINDVVNNLCREPEFPAFTEADVYRAKWQAYKGAFEDLAERHDRMTARALDAERRLTEAGEQR